MQANHLNGYLIMPNQILTIPNGGSGSGSGGTTQTSGNYTYLHSTIKTYTLKVNAWYVFDKRSQAGKPISTYWSDAKYWASNAANDGYQVDNTPSVGAIMQVHLDHMVM